MDHRPTVEELEMARRVRAEHDTGTCPECRGKGGPCHRYAAWLPIMVDLPALLDDERPSGVIVWIAGAVLLAVGTGGLVVARLLLG